MKATADFTRVRRRPACYNVDRTLRVRKDGARAILRARRGQRGLSLNRKRVVSTRRNTSTLPALADLRVGRSRSRPSPLRSGSKRATRPRVAQPRRNRTMQNIATEDPLAVAAVESIHNGHVETLKRMLAENPFLANLRLRGATSCDGREMSRTLLHVVTDWPGHFPNGAESVGALVAAGADVNARFEGPHAETPLHWAASSDDVAVLDALLDHGADIESPGAVIGGGTPLADAAAFGQWKAAHRLVERGAKTSLWEAAALGLMDRVEQHFAGQPLEPWSPRPSQPTGNKPDEVTHAFWCACHGGQQQVAEFLLNRDADIQWVGYDELTPLGAAGAAAPTRWSPG